MSTTTVHTLGNKGLTTGTAGLKYRKFQRNSPPRYLIRATFRIYDCKAALLPAKREHKQPCKHPRVQIVSRDEDAEFVECKECGEVFESSEFKDMNIEESAESEQE